MEEKSQWYLWILIPLGFFVAIPFGVLILATNGGTKGTGKIEYEVLIQKPPAEVYPFVSQTEKRLEWTEDLKESIPLTPGEIRGGFKSQEVYKLGGKEVDYDAEIVALVPSTKFSLKFTAEDYLATEVYDLVNQNNNTRLKFSSNIGYHDSFRTFISPYLIFQKKRAMERSLEDLKILVESQ